MADVQIRAAGPSAAPLDYVVPGAHEIDITMLSAHFDGTSASVAWLPAIEILSDGGTSCGIIPQDVSVAAGASVEAAWAPFLGRGGGASSAAASVSWGTIAGTDGAFPDTGFGSQNVDMSSGSFVTTDTATFGVGVGGGIHGLSLKVKGTYLVWATVAGNTGVLPHAGSMIQVSTDNILSSPLDQVFEGPWLADGGGSWSALAGLSFITIVGIVSNPAPNLIQLGAGQNSGGAISLDAWLGATFLGPAVP